MLTGIKKKPLVYWQAPPKSRLRLRLAQRGRPWCGWGSRPVVSRDATVAAMLAALGAKGVMLVPQGVVLAS